MGKSDLYFSQIFYLKKPLKVDIHQAHVAQNHYKLYKFKLILLTCLSSL